MKRQQIVLVGIFALLLSACGANAADTIAGLESANQEWVARSSQQAQIQADQYATIEELRVYNSSLIEELANRMAEIEALNDRADQRKEQLATAQAAPSEVPELIRCVNFDHFAALSFGYIKGIGAKANRPAYDHDDCLYFSFTFGNGDMVNGRLSIDGTYTATCQYLTESGDKFSCHIALFRIPGESPNLNAQGTISNGDTICLAATKLSYTGPCQ